MDTKVVETENNWGAPILSVCARKMQMNPDWDVRIWIARLRIAAAVFDPYQHLESSAHPAPTVSPFIVIMYAFLCKFSLIEI